MLNAAGDKVLPVIPQLIIPIKRALNGKNPGVMASTLRVIQHLCMCGWYKESRNSPISSCSHHFAACGNRETFFSCFKYVPELHFPQCSSDSVAPRMLTITITFSVLPQLHMILKQMSFALALSGGEKSIKIPFHVARS
jgi:hypothetical protein